MSPEMNGNPPSVIKRKKNKKPAAANIDLNNSTSYFANNLNNVSTPDMTAYYSFLNYSQSSEPVSLPGYPVNYNNYPANNCMFGQMNKYSSTPRNFLQPPLNGQDNVECLSLPVGQVDPDLYSSKRRFSDPGLPNDSDSSTGSFDARLVRKLSQQVTVLKENYKKLSREVMEMRVELNLYKQHSNSRHFEKEYEPGMLTDIIREVRDAARIREDALIARVQHIMEEKQLNMSHLHLVSEKNRSNDRITKLEEQLRNLSTVSKAEESTISHTEDNNSARQVIDLEREALDLRRELQDTRAKKEEADQKIMQLDKKLSQMLHHSNRSISDLSDLGKETSDTLSTTTTSTSSQVLPRVRLSGPVTDL